jgi:hypothetical protein
MSVKLTDVQLVMMSAAGQRDDRCLAAPDTMKGAALSKARETEGAWISDRWLGLIRLEAQRGPAR